MTVTSLGVPSVMRPVGPAPTDGPLLDTYGRVATDLRVSLTDRCNLRCTYCMPAEGLDWLPDSQLLNAGELARLLRIAVTRLGITSVRFTGGNMSWYPRQCQGARCGKDQPLVPSRGQSLDHVAFAVADFDALFARLRAANVKILETPHTFGNTRAFMIEDPDGLAIEIVAKTP